MRPFGAVPVERHADRRALQIRPGGIACAPGDRVADGARRGAGPALAPATPPAESARTHTEASAVAATGSEGQGPCRILMGAPWRPLPLFRDRSTPVAPRPYHGPRRPLRDHLATALAAARSTLRQVDERLPRSPAASRAWISPPDAFIRPPSHTAASQQSLLLMLELGIVVRQRWALLKSVPVRSAARSSAKCRSALYRLARRRSAPLRSAPLRLEKVRSPSLRSAPLRSAPFRSAPLRSAPGAQVGPGAYGERLDHAAGKPLTTGGGVVDEQRRGTEVALDPGVKIGVEVGEVAGRRVEEPGRVADHVLVRFEVGLAQFHDHGVVAVIGVEQGERGVGGIIEKAEARPGAGEAGNRDLARLACGAVGEPDHLGVDP